MIRLQRYVLGELLGAFLLVLLIVTGIYFTGGMLQFLHRYPQLGMVSVLKASPFIVPAAFPVTIPLSLLMACLLTYGRFAHDNEFLALKMGGVHPWHAVAPAVLVGALLCGATLLLNTEILPLATLARKTVARDAIQQSVRAMEDPSLDHLELGDFQMSWAGSDERGFKTDVLITWPEERRPESGGPRERVLHQVSAGAARLFPPEEGSDDLLLVVEDLTFEQGSGEETVRLEEEERHIALPLEQLAGVPPIYKSKGTDEMRAEELYYRIRRLGRELAQGGGSAAERDYLRKLEGEYWRRIAMGLSPLAFALVGAALGLAGTRGGRMAAVVMAVLVALPVYYPLLFGGQNWARTGGVPAWLGLNLGNLALGAVALHQLRRVVRG